MMDVLRFSFLGVRAIEIRLRKQSLVACARLLDADCCWYAISCTPHPKLVPRRRERAFCFVLESCGTSHAPCSDIVNDAGVTTMESWSHLNHIHSPTFVSISISKRQHRLCRIDIIPATATATTITAACAPYITAARGDRARVRLHVHSNARARHCYFHRLRLSCDTATMMTFCATLEDHRYVCRDRRRRRRRQLAGTSSFV
jgi:hypothetical protein